MPAPSYSMAVERGISLTMFLQQQYAMQSLQAELDLQSALDREQLMFLTVMAAHTEAFFNRSRQLRDTAYRLSDFHSVPLLLPPFHPNLCLGRMDQAMTDVLLNGLMRKM